MTWSYIVIIPAMLHRITVSKDIAIIICSYRCKMQCLSDCLPLLTFVIVSCYTYCISWIKCLLIFLENFILQFTRFLYWSIFFVLNYVSKVMVELLSSWYSWLRTKMESYLVSTAEVAFLCVFWVADSPCFVSRGEDKDEK